MLELLQLLERPEPTVAVPFTCAANVIEVGKVSRYAQVAELRADLFEKRNKLPNAIKALSAVLPVLLTVRHTSECGGSGGIDDDSLRMSYYEALGCHAEGFDIEINAAIRDKVIEMAKSTGKVAIASYHNFETTPSISELEELLEKGMLAGGDYVKFAMRANNSEEYYRQVDFLLSNNQYGLIMVAMDNPEANPSTNFGPLSRSFFPSLGSHLTYASITGNCSRSAHCPDTSRGILTLRL